MAATVAGESATILAGSHYLSSSGGHYDFGPPIGELLFKGRPFGPGNSDTIYQRLEDAVLPRFGASVRIPIEMVKVSLESIQPLEIDGRAYDVVIGLTPGTRSTGEMRLVLHAPDDGTSKPNGIYDTNVAIFFTAELISRDGLSAPIQKQADIFIKSTAHGRWSFNPERNAVSVDTVAARALATPDFVTSNFFVVGVVPMLDTALMAGGANMQAILA